MAVGFVDAGLEPLSRFEMAVLDAGGDLYAIAYTILQDHGEAEDAVQLTMERAWQEWGTLRETASARAWMRKICVREAVRSRRRLFNWRRRSEPEPASLAGGVETDLDMTRAYDSLTAQQRAVVTLHYQYGYTLDECAELIGCAPGTARSHLARALDKLRKELT